GPRRLPPQAEP
ncbi:hypothetical protein BN1723_020544, partial [Verticillium longisporum]